MQIISNICSTYNTRNIRVMLWCPLKKNSDSLQIEGKSGHFFSFVFISFFLLVLMIKSYSIATLYRQFIQSRDKCIGSKHLTSFCKTLVLLYKKTKKQNRIRITEATYGTNTLIFKFQYNISIYTDLHICATFKNFLCSWFSLCTTQYDHLERFDGLIDDNNKITIATFIPGIQGCPCELISPTNIFLCKCIELNDSSSTLQLRATQPSVNTILLFTLDG